MADRLILIRHAETGPDYSGCFIGRLDVPLSDKGLRQARLLRRVVVAAVPGRCISSPMRRVLETAREAGVSNPEIDPDLREIDFGEWEGLTFQAIQASASSEIDRWANYEPDFAFPSGECIGEFVSRISKIGDMLAAEPVDTVLAFTHGGVIRALICHYLGLDPRNYLLFDVKPASVTTLDLFDGKGVLTGLNVTCHLEDV